MWRAKLLEQFIKAWYYGLSCRDHVQANIPSPNNCRPAPSTYMTLMYNHHYTLPTTNYHAPTETWLVHGNKSPPLCR